MSRIVFPSVLEAQRLPDGRLALTVLDYKNPAVLTDAQAEDLVTFVLATRHE